MLRSYRSPLSFTLFRRRYGLSLVSNGRLLGWAICALAGLVCGLLLYSSLRPMMPQLLSDPFLQQPTATAVRVVWFTEFAGSQHRVEYGDKLEHRAIATTYPLTRVREDQQSQVGTQRLPAAEQPEPGQPEAGQIYQQPTSRNIWRHEAEVTGLTANRRVPYRVVSLREDGRAVRCDRFTLAPLPAAATPLKILLTSDHQLKPMTAANLQKVVETVGQVDAVFFAGDLVDTADRASEWFDNNRGNAFFPTLQGRAQYELEKNGVKTRYRGGAIIQSAPLFPVIGNHEVMGRFSSEATLSQQFNDPYPRQIAKQLYAAIAPQVNPTQDPAIQQTWLKNNSFNVDTYEEIFSLPTTSPGGKKYYALSFGDVRLIGLDASVIWRSPSLNADAKGRFRERDEDLTNPAQWGYGQHLFEPIAAGSAQYEWLKTELNRPEFRQAKYKVVMFHHPPHSLGDNIVPAYTDPVQTIDRFADGQIKAVRYEYPIESDYLIRDLMPLLESAGVHLVFYGHSHLWNRFVSPTGMNFLETSNVGNTYGAYLTPKRRQIPIGYRETYAASGNPNGLPAVMPNISPIVDAAGYPQPYIASNDITAFSILNTDTGQVSSYYFDTTQPDSAVVKFDEFPVNGRSSAP